MPDVPYNLFPVSIQRIVSCTAQVTGASEEEVRRHLDILVTLEREWKTEARICREENERIKANIPIKGAVSLGDQNSAFLPWFNNPTLSPVGPCSVINNEDVEVPYRRGFEDGRKYEADLADGERKWKGE